MKALRIERRVETPRGTFTELGIAVRVQIPEAEYDEVLAMLDRAPHDADPEVVDIWGDNITVLGEFPAERAPRLQERLKAIKERMALGLIPRPCD